MSTVAVCGAAYLFGRHRIACPTCGQETDFVTAFSGPWYGDILTCLGCGDAWEDGEMLPRPFKRAWRQESTRKARERWETALPREEYLAACSAVVVADLDLRPERSVEDVPLPASNDPGTRP